jgi:exopolyphosphatase/guanosine-5'-triphosphate,3'-diphosphate pyrophosphatase
MHLAAIDIGTNSVLLTVAEVVPGPPPALRPLLERAEITRLGRGVDRSGMLSAEGMDATLQVLRAYGHDALSQGVPAAEVACVATSAARDARNGEAFLARVERACGLRPQIIGGMREAGLAYLAARAEFGVAGRALLVQDIGGGSTELVFGEAVHPSFERSLLIGSVRLFERWVSHDPPSPEERRQVEDDIAAALREVTVPGGAACVGLAGTWTTLAAIGSGSPSYDAARVHGSTLSRGDVAALAERLWRSPLAERRQMPGLQPGRADVIPVGASIAHLSMEALALDRVTVSDRGVRWGLLYERVFGQR